MEQPILVLVVQDGKRIVLILHLLVITLPLMKKSDKANDVRIRSQRVFDGLLLDRSALYQHYKTSCGRAVEVSPKMFWNDWKHCIPETVTLKKSVRNAFGQVCRGIELPELAVARASFCKAMHMQLDFDEIDCRDTRKKHGCY